MEIFFAVGESISIVARLKREDGRPTIRNTAQKKIPRTRSRFFLVQFGFIGLLGDRSLVTDSPEVRQQTEGD